MSSLVSYEAGESSGEEEEGAVELPSDPCYMCKVASAKYTCPRCELRSCSLRCCVQHKKRFDCDGKRDEAQFVRVRNFTDSTLRSDINYLDTAERVKSSKTQLYYKNLYHVSERNAWVQRLWAGCKRRQIMLRTLPIQLKRAQQNKTLYVAKMDCIMWQVEWKFMDSKRQYLQQKVRENVALSVAFDRLLEETEDLKLCEPEEYKFVLVLQPTGYRRAKGVEISLEDNLLNKLKNFCIVEFPTIKVFSLDACIDEHVAEVGELSDELKEALKRRYQRNEESHEDADSEDPPLKCTPPQERPQYLNESPAAYPAGYAQNRPRPPPQNFRPWFGPGYRQAPGQHCGQPPMRYPPPMYPGQQLMYPPPPQQWPVYQ